MLTSTLNALFQCCEYKVKTSMHRLVFRTSGVGKAMTYIYDFKGRHQAIVTKTRSPLLNLCFSLYFGMAAYSGSLPFFHLILHPIDGT